jgi:dTDP-4-amino-4,6-dideoxygalactose transaminase
VPLHLQPCFEYLNHKPGDFPEAEQASLETVALPCFPELTEQQQRYVADVLSTFVIAGKATGNSDKAGS